MELIDTHSHIFLDEFNTDRSEAIQRANEKGISKIILPNVDLTTIKQLSDCVNSYPSVCYPAIGIHPSSIKNDFKNDILEIEQLLKEQQFVAIGEIGIDLYWDKTFKNKQIEALEYQFEIAEKYNLPVILHNRDAFDEIIKVIENFGKNRLNGVFHCFTGNIDQANKIIELGFYLGIGGVVTFKNAEVQNTIKKLSLKNIILETDSPYLSPAPKRGKRNESSYIHYIAEKISELKNTSILDVAEATSHNTKQIFELNKY